MKKIMPAFTALGAAFDTSLPLAERRNAQAAVAVIAGALFVGALGVGAAAFGGKANSGRETARAEPPRDVRVLGADIAAGKPCDDQTWPYIEARCLTAAKPTENTRTTPKHGLASANVLLPSPEPPQQAASETERMAGLADGTTGSAPPADDAGKEAKAIDDIPLPRPRSAVLASIPDAAEASEPQDRFFDQRPLTRREWRQMRREEVREMRRAYREMQQQRREAWLEERAARRGSHYGRERRQDAARPGAFDN